LIFEISGTNSEYYISFLEFIPKIHTFAKKQSMIKRTLEDNILKALDGKHAIIVMGPRQVGKSTLLHTLFSDKENVLWLNGDEPDVQDLFENATSTRLRALIGTARWVVLDEAQRIPDIGMRLKLITDQIPEVKLIATGSSSFDLSRKVNESLTGRKREFQLFPISFTEMVQQDGLLQETRMLPHRMVYGYYPEVVTSSGEEKTVLRELTDSYLYRDILAMDAVGKPDKLVRLVKALALQIGSQVSYNELAQIVGLDSKTVEKYIDVLEKSYIVFRLPSFARNLRNELKFSRKVYFYDLGIRNAVLGNFISVESRSPEEVGHLWENFVICERIKNNSYSHRFAQLYFWRSQQMKEIDLIEEEDGKLRAFEIKWNPTEKVRIPKAFSEAYPEADFQVISPDSIDRFLL